MTSFPRQLNIEYEEAIRWIDVDGAPVQDFAAEAGITANNASVRVFRAREALRKQVRKITTTIGSYGHNATVGSSAVDRTRGDVPRNGYKLRERDPRPPA